MKQLKWALSVVAIVCASASQLQAAFVNGDFQTGNLSGWTPYTTAGGALGAGYPQVLSFDTDGDGGSSLAAVFNVGRTASLGPAEGGGIFQVFNWAGGDLSIAADIASSTLGVPSNNGGGLFELLFNGVVVSSHDFGFIAGNTVGRASLSATILGAAAGSHEIRFRITRGFITDSNTPLEYIDDVTMSAVNASAVPEPGTLALLGLGSVGLAAGKLRKRRQAVAATV